MSSSTVLKATWTFLTCPASHNHLICKKKGLPIPILNSAARTLSYPEPRPPARLRPRSLGHLEFSRLRQAFAHGVCVPHLPIAASRRSSPPASNCSPKLQHDEPTKPSTIDRGGGAGCCTGADATSDTGAAPPDMTP
jgi:hypothetical protein